MVGGIPVDSPNKNANNLFALFSVILFALFLCYISMCSIDKFIRLISGIDILNLFGTGPSIGPNKVFGFKLSLIIGIVVNIGIFAILYRHKGKVYRLIMLVMIMFLYLLSYNFYMFPTYNPLLINQLRIVNLPSIEYGVIFSKQHMKEEKINTFDDFYEFVIKRYSCYEEQLNTKWNIENEKLLKSIFFMNLVSSMWGYGNINNPDIPASVLVNENTSFKELDTREISIKTYINADIGSCTDYAYILKSLLDKEGIKNKLVAIPGHFFNEIIINNKSYTLDANVNMLFYSSWEDIHYKLNYKEDSLKVSIFPHSNLEKNNTFYRARIGRFWLQTLLVALEKTALPITYPDLPDYIKAVTQK